MTRTSGPKPGPSWLTFKGHFSTVCKHKACVMDLCFKAGLYKQGLFHDMSKFSPTEFCMGVCYWQGTRSPNDAEREHTGLSTAWLHHKGRNKHHLEYWIDYSGRRDGVMDGKPMPTRYVIEMFCDRVAACKVYQGDSYSPLSPLAYYERSKDLIILHPDSRALLESMLQFLAENGEDATMKHIKDELVIPRFTLGQRGRF